MKTNHHSYCLLALMLILSGCASVQIKSETNTNSDLKTFNFYTMVDTEEGFLPNVSPVQKMQIENAISTEVEKLSTISNNSGVTGPDILVSYFVVIDTKKDVDTYTNYYRGRKWRYQITDVDIREYKEGTLLLDFIDAKTNEVVWHGSATATITSNSIQLEKKINDAVTALFQRFKKDQIK